VPEAEVAEVEQVFGQYGLTPEQVRPVVEAFRSRPRAWVEFMMRYELGLEQPDPKAALTGALTIATAYVVGGLIPLTPYFAAREAHSALGFSIGVTLVALFLFGYVKGRFTGARPIRSGIQTTLIGGLAAGAAFALAKMFA
jgi:VIT1/CCC1 family predicted Fe2+/Mn2+ transporter